MRIEVFHDEEPVNAAVIPAATEVPIPIPADCQAALGNGAIAGGFPARRLDRAMAEWSGKLGYGERWEHRAEAGLDFSPVPPLLQLGRDLCLLDYDGAKVVIG